MSAGCCWNCSTLYAIATFFPPSGCHEMLRTCHVSRVTCHVSHVTAAKNTHLVTLLLGVHGSLNTVRVFALGGLPLWSTNSPSK